MPVWIFLCDAGLLHDTGLHHDAGLHHKAGMRRIAGLHHDAGLRHDTGLRHDAGLRRIPDARGINLAPVTSPHPTCKGTVPLFQAGATDHAEPCDQPGRSPAPQHLIAARRLAVSASACSALNFQHISCLERPALRQAGYGSKGPPAANRRTHSWHSLYTQHTRNAGNLTVDRPKPFFSAYSPVQQ